MSFRRELQVKMVKPNRPSTDLPEPERSHIPTDLIAKITKKDVIRVTVGAVAVYASVVAVNTLSTIAINAAPKR